MDLIESQDLNLDTDVELDEPTITGDIDEPEIEDTNIEDKEDSTEGEEDKDIKKNEPPAFKAVTAKYPNLFKDFPGLRHAFYHEREYRKAFPSVEEAQEAAVEIGNLRELESSLTSGDVGDLTTTLKNISRLGDTVVGNLAINFLPALQKSSPEDYYTAITPILVNVCRSAYDNGVANDNENLKNTGLLLAQMLFKDQKVASGETKLGTPTAKIKDNSLDNERKSFKQERYTTLLNDVTQDTNNQLAASIQKGLDSKGTMTSHMKEMLTQEVRKEIDKVLGSDPIYMSQIKSLWKKAEGDNFSSSYKTKIAAAYLRRANEIMPQIRSKIRSSALGLRQKSSDTNHEPSERREPKNNVGGGGQSRSTNIKGLDPRSVDWKKTTDMDLIRGTNVTLKK